MITINKLVKKASPMLFGHRTVATSSIADSLKGLVGRNFLSIDELRLVYEQA